MTIYNHKDIMGCVVLHICYLFILLSTNPYCMPFKPAFLLTILLSFNIFCHAQIPQRVDPDIPAQKASGKAVDEINDQIMLYLLVNGDIPLNIEAGRNLNYMTQFDGFDNIGKLKSIGNTAITYYDRFDLDNFGKLKSIGNTRITYYDRFDQDNFGKLKSVGNIAITWYDRFDAGYIYGKLKSIGNMPVTYYDQLDGFNIGKLKSIGNIQFTYYNRFDNIGKLKSIGNVRITWYNGSDMPENYGKLKSVGHVKISYFDKYDPGENAGKIKAIDGDFASSGLIKR